MSSFCVTGAGSLSRKLCLPLNFGLAFIWVGRKRKTSIPRIEMSNNKQLNERANEFLFLNMLATTLLVYIHMYFYIVFNYRKELN